MLEQLRHGHAYFEDTIVQYCSKLEVIEWTNTTTERGYLINANGRSLTPIAHLKELYFDNCCFRCNYYSDKSVWVAEYGTMSMLNDHPNLIPVHELRDKTDRTGIDSEYRLLCYNMRDRTRTGLLSQNVLITFVRNAPTTLVWLRNNLSASHIRLLQSEYPDIISHL